MSFKQDILFNQNVDIDGIDDNMQCRAMQVEDMSFSLINPDEIEFKSTISDGHECTMR